MTTNIATGERWLRLLAGLVLTYVSWSFHSYWPLAAAIILVATAIIGWCPLYRIFGRGANRPTVRNPVSNQSNNPLSAGFSGAASAAVADVSSGKAALMDVRRDDEWALGHAPMALHWELAKLEAGQLPDIPKDRPVFVHCAAGARAGQAMNILKQAGWEQVTNLGGLNNWEAAGGAVVHE